MKLTKGVVVVETPDGAVLVTKKGKYPLKRQVGSRYWGYAIVDDIAYFIEVAVVGDDVYVSWKEGDIVLAERFIESHPLIEM